MAFLPEELVHTIADEIEDIPSLKAFALAGSMFRRASQRILLRSFSVKQNIEEAHTLLEESPHIAAFITRLVIRLDFLVLAETSIEKIYPRLHQIFSKMANVRQCILYGTFPESGTFISALLDFLARQPLRELNVLFWKRIPAAIIQRFFTIAPVISFCQSGVEENPRLLSDNPQHKPKVKDFFVEETALQVCDLLAQPQFEWYISTLRRLSIPSLDNAAALKLLVATAPMLEHLRLRDINGTVLLPALPLLRSIDFSISFHHNTNPRFWDLISSTLTTSPLLTNLIISLEHLYSSSPDEALLTNLDTALAVHPMRPVLRWRYDLARLPSGSLRRGILAKCLAEFAAVETGMPKAHREERLLFETHAATPKQ